MKKPKPQALLERLPFPELRTLSLLSKFLPEEEQLKHEAEVKAHNDAVIENLKELTFIKLFLLMKYHDIDPADPNHWLLLATKLAQQYEPGFQMQSAPSGRSNKWDFVNLLGLFTLVEYICESKKNCSVSNACNIINNQYLPDLKSSKKTLENKYLDAKNNKLLVKWYGIALSVDQIQGNFSARNMILKEAFGIEI
ncbi:hypothetical protein [Acinetobacter sp. YH12238]|uniref:hypothetical protein n=1 Tax=Acinetobacter sp. YH12238 TaxID=2601165 RepID=UPI0015D2D257|nr:hypothetical protein [Acinetobacter sp. YH12238]